LTLSAIPLLVPADQLGERGRGLQRAFGRPLDASRDAIVAPRHAEVEAHRHAVAPVRDELANGLLADPRHHAVERVQHGVEHARLAGAGGAGNREQRHRREVERLLALAVTGEAFDVETEGTHAYSVEASW
jgi:hypothetical protein